MSTEELNNLLAEILNADTTDARKLEICDKFRTEYATLTESNTTSKDSLTKLMTEYQALKETKVNEFFKGTAEQAGEIAKSSIEEVEVPSYDTLINGEEN